MQEPAPNQDHPGETGAAEDRGRPGPRRRRRTWRRWLLVGCVCLLLSLPLINLILLAPWPKQKLANAVGRYLGVSLAVQRATVWPWSGVQLQGVRFGQQENNQGAAPHFWCQSMRVSPRWGSLVTRTWEIRRVEMHHFDFVGQHLFGNVPPTTGPLAELTPHAQDHLLPSSDPLAPQLPTPQLPAAESLPRAGAEPGTDPAAPPPELPRKEVVPPEAAGPIRERARGFLRGGRPQVEVGEIILSEGALRVLAPGGEELQIMRVHDVMLTLDFGGENSRGSGRMTVARVEWLGGWNTSGLEAEVVMQPGPILTMRGNRPGVDGLSWHLEVALTQPGMPFLLEVAAKELLLTELFDDLPPWVASQPTWINGRATGVGLAAHPSTVQTAMQWRIENLGLHLDDQLRKHLGGHEGGRLEEIDVQSAGLDLALRGGAVMVEDLFVKTPDGIGRSRFAVNPDGRLQGAMRLYATDELRGMVAQALPDAPWIRFKPTHWHTSQVELGGPWQAPMMRFNGQDTPPWWPLLERLRSLVDSNQPSPSQPPTAPPPMP